MTRAVEGVEDDPDRGAADIALLDVGNADLVVGITTSGRTPYVLARFAKPDAAVRPQSVSLVTDLACWVRKLTSRLPLLSVRRSFRDRHV